MRQKLLVYISTLLLVEISIFALEDRFDPITADLAIYSLSHKTYGKKWGLTDDEIMPRVYVHSIYKFGDCTPQMIQKPFLRKTTNITLTDMASSKTGYIYLLEAMHTQRFRFQCIVLKIMVARPFVFRRGRLPMVYCQGILRYVYLMTFQKIELHEFYFQNPINMPATIIFEFYHVKFLDRHADYPVPKWSF